MISPLTGSERYESIGRITGQLSPDEVTAAMRRGAEGGWDFDEGTIEIAKAGGTKEIF